MLGVFLGSALWFLTLSGSVAMMRHMISDGVFRRINQTAAVLLACFGVYAVQRVVRPRRAGLRDELNAGAHAERRRPLSRADAFTDRSRVVRSASGERVLPVDHRGDGVDHGSDPDHVLHGLLGDALLDDLVLVALDAHAAAVDGRHGERPQFEIDLVHPGLPMTFMRRRAGIWA